MQTVPSNTYYKALYALLNVFILYIPINSYFEISAFLSGDLLSWTEVRSPIYVKLFKDLFLVCSLFLTVKYVTAIFNKKLAVFNMFAIFFVLSILISIAFVKIEVVFLGIRAYWAILLIFVGFVYNKLDLKKISTSLMLVFLVHLTLQLIEMVYAPPIFSGKLFGLNVRNPGVFMVPGIGGAFALLCYYVFNQIKNKVFQYLAIVSLILSNSTIGLLIFLAYLLFVIIKKIRYWYLLIPLILACVALVILNLGVITGRGSYVWISAFSRVGILVETFSNLNNFLFGNGLGIATSGAFLYKVSNAIIPDNTFAGIYLNVGFIGLILMILIYFQIFTTVPTLLALMYFGYGSSQLIFEMSPVIQLLMIFLGVYIFKRPPSFQPRWWVLQKNNNKTRKLP